MATQHCDPFASYQYGEGRTGIGQTVQFSCPSGRTEDVRAFLAENVRTIQPPVTHKAGLAHGAYVGYSRYDLQQHEYAGSMHTYIEVLEIKDAPDGRWGIVFYEYNPYEGCSFSEWATVEDARAAFKAFVNHPHAIREKPHQLAGFKRLVRCGPMTPWFYAIGDEELVGDYTFPHGLQDDATYRFGRKFVVCDGEGTPSVRTCMGTRLFKEKDRNYPYAERQYRIIYWNDGSSWRESAGSRHGVPRPIEDGELWIAEAVEQFRELLAGKCTDFFIKFTDGTQFVGKLAEVKRRASCVQGRYLLVVNLKGRQEPLEGWVDFTPTSEAPDVVQFVTQKYAENGREVERIEVKKCEKTQSGKKWAGVFLKPPD